MGIVLYLQDRDPPKIETKDLGSRGRRHETFRTQSSPKTTR